MYGLLSLEVGWAIRTDWLLSHGVTEHGGCFQGGFTHDMKYRYIQLFHFILDFRKLSCEFRFFFSLLSMCLVT